MKKLFSVLALACFLFAACKTTSGIYIGGGGNLIFITPVEAKKINPIIQKVSVDMTFHIQKSKLYQNSVCNYTLTVAKSDISVADDVEVSLVWQDESGLRQISAVKKERLFREAGGSKVNVRFSVELDKDEVAQMLASSSVVKIMFVTPGTYNVRIESEDFNKKVDDVRLLLL